ncbi:geminin coiled-coil domain-containing protein 1 [Eublepharis macularius]|uniref:Geminin coiled-coil domain-containing protein 1 n=1 Tax=Eublepharis macularius TaxID=481883 RepID=A0AA97JJJ5_EUBMA|nr:geminin coiled-coil domain-containing protein 1 [Eublepharis macularius]
MNPARRRCRQLQHRHAALQVEGAAGDGGGAGGDRARVPGGIAAHPGGRPLGRRAPGRRPAASEAPRPPLLSAPLSAPLLSRQSSAAPAFAGGPVCARPRPGPTAAAAAAAKVAPETWLDSAWAAAAALLHGGGGEDEDGAGPGPQQGAGGPDHFGSLPFAPDVEVRPGDQLSTQIYRNKQLQDTLLQKEEELAQLQAENRHLKQFLSSTLVRQLEEKAKKLLWQNGRKACGAFKRHLKAEGPHPPREPPPAPKARRNLLGDFSACEEQPSADVDVWVLRTLGLKDINTIDESSSANYSALTLDPAPASFLCGPAETTDFGISTGQPAVYRCDALAPMDRSPANARKEPLPAAPQLPSSLPHSNTPRASCGLPSCSDNISLPKAHVAFTTSVSPHCNVKTHTFRQGQAFVRRDEDGGWKLTWVPKKPE